MTEPNRSVRVQLDQRGYDIHIGKDVLEKTGVFLRGFFPGNIIGRANLAHAVIITDSHVEDLYAQRVSDSLKASGVKLLGGENGVFSIPAGEPSKSVEQAEQLWRRLLECGADRKTVVVAVGGGVVGDLAGFVAATYARGVPFVQIPTTLLAQVDSSVGGKVGINLPGAKNMVGAFWQPVGVLIDTATLHTLPEREYRAGLAEVVKYGVILPDFPPGSGDFFAFLENHIPQIQNRDDQILAQVVARCCEIKADIVRADEREESGLRALLNYGHTFGHALEAVTGYNQLLHGEAVSIGMMCAARLAHLLGRVENSFVQRQKQLLVALDLPTETPAADSQELLQAMRRDKKTQHGQLRFILPSQWGKGEMVAGVSTDKVISALGPIH